MRDTLRLSKALPFRRTNGTSCQLADMMFVCCSGDISCRRRGTNNTVLPAPGPWACVLIEVHLCCVDVTWNRTANTKAAFLTRQHHFLGSVKWSKFRISNLAIDFLITKRFFLFASTASARATPLRKEHLCEGNPLSFGTRSHATMVEMQEQHKVKGQDIR